MGFVSDFFGDGDIGDIFAGGQADVLDLWGFQAEDEAREAAEGASQAQESAAREGLAETRRQFDLTRQDLAPWLAAGTGALELQQNLLGVGGVDAQRQAYANYLESPGQQFLRERGERALVANASAIGGLGGGNVRSALQQQGIGFAAQDFGNYYNRLAGLSSTGQTTGQQLGGFGANFASSTAGLYGNIGQARASGLLGAQQASAQQQQQATGLATTVGGFFLSDRRMKRDIRKLDLKKCYDDVMAMPLYSWKYLQETGLDQDAHIGVMVQDAPAMIKHGNTLNINDELMLIAGALQYMKNEGLIKCH